MTTPSGPLLYTALGNLTVSSAIATWFAHPGDVLPLDPTRLSTQNLLTAGKIALAPPNSVDNTTPPGTLRGQPGLHAPHSVSN